ncbi:MAG: hypothetical protein ACXABY_30745 [Candidatus Thorarchaeota archaeon]|jgi:hypothetical protein
MEHKRFEEVFEKIVGMCRDLLVAKNAEYARGDDKLHNFKKAAAFTKSGLQEVALQGMMLKHTVSVYDMIDDMAEGNYAPVEKWEEKIMDHINYLILLYAMVVELEDKFEFTKVQYDIDMKLTKEEFYAKYPELRL